MHVPLNLQKKYFVFEDALLSLFEKCENCSSTTTNITKTTIGTFLHVKQQCQCGHIRYWESQPFVRNTPAGNIILSASILFAGASLSKALRVLEFLAVHPFLLELFFATSLYICSQQFGLFGSTINLVCLLS